MRFKLTTFLLIVSMHAYAQSNENEISTKDIVESVAEVLPEDFDMTELTEVLNNLRRHPINLNNTDSDQLKAIIFLSPLQISNLFIHIKENGRLVNVLELQTIDGFDVKTVQSLIPFVCVNLNTEYEQLTYKKITTFGENDLIIRYAQILQQQKGFTDLTGNRYLGDRERLLAKYKYNYGTIFSSAITLEKDAGEKLLGKPSDFFSANAALFKLGKFKKIVLGDYSLQFGQGLTLWSGFSFGKGPDVTSVVKKDVGLKPYSSANEYSFLRGVSTTMQITKKIDLTSFVSFRKLDASQSINANGELVQSTINQTGLHRTPSEIKNRNTVKQQVYGAVIQYSSNELSIGGIVYHSNYGSDFNTQKPLYDKFSFTGKSLSNAGLYYNYTYKNIYFYCEASTSSGISFAYLTGALISLSPTVSTAITYRHYPRNYHNFFNQAMAESSEAVNEKGIYTGLNIIPNKHWSFAVYADFFKFSWLKFRVDGPSAGYEVFAQAIYSPTKTFKIISRFKSENKQQNTDLNVPVNFLEDVKRENYRLDVNWSFNKLISLQNRIEISQFKKGESKAEFGYLIYQDIDYSPMVSKLTGNIRLAYFNCASYNSRIYAYEDDVLYSFAFGMYNGRGVRTYLNLKYKVVKKLTIWARYASYIYKDVSTVGSYLDEIEGNKKSEIKILMRYQF